MSANMAHARKKLALRELCDRAAATATAARPSMARDGRLVVAIRRAFRVLDAATAARLSSRRIQNVYT